MRKVMSTVALAVLAACQQAATPPAVNGDSRDSAATHSGHAGGGRVRSAANSGPTATPSARVSQYSSLGKDNCTLVEESDEGPYWRMHCGGAGGFSVDYTESDLRQNISVIAPDGAKTSLDLPSKVAHGAFDRLGSKIEWRGPAGKAPDMLVVRVHVANDQGEDDGGHLAVAKLAPKPCLIAIVPPDSEAGARAPVGQNDRARALADKGGACLERPTS